MAVAGRDHPEESPPLNGSMLFEATRFNLSGVRRLVSPARPPARPATPHPLPPPPATPHPAAPRASARSPPGPGARGPVRDSDELAGIHAPR
jgi:hypothetical protein